MPGRGAHHAKNLRVSNAPAFDLFAHHSFSLSAERIFAGEEQTGTEAGHDKICHQASGHEIFQSVEIIALRAPGTVRLVGAIVRSCRSKAAKCPLTSNPLVLAMPFRKTNSGFIARTRLINSA